MSREARGKPPAVRLTSGLRQQRQIAAVSDESAVPSIADVLLLCGERRNGPCVDGSELARVFFTSAGLVGAAMCSAFERGSRDRWP
jgi:hypothetical protein